MPTPITRFLLIAGCLTGATVVFGLQHPVAADAAPPTLTRSATVPPANKYVEVCQVCHQATGLGLEGAFPPLAGSEWVSGAAVVPIAIVLKGLQGEIVVKGKTYNGAMMAWESSLTDADLAATLTYTRTQWGNRGTPVSAAQVRAARARFAARKTPWTAAELKALK